jgi:uncharacterized membrane protein YfcA
MDFLISGQHINLFYLIGVGFVIGVFGGFFGVGGSFLAGPALFAVGMPMNMVVGTDLAHIVGKSIVATKKHRTLGNVDMKLAGIMVIGTILGSEIGAQGIEALKRRGDVDVVVGVSFVVVLVCITSFMAWEAVQTLRLKTRKNEGATKKDKSVLSHVAKTIQGIQAAPMLHFPVSGIRRISFWVILLVSFVGGVFSGFLGGGAGYIRMPLLVYLLGVPTHVAVGTDLFEVMISASYGTLTHAVKGNVDIMVALVMHTGAAIGAQIGAVGTQYFSGTKIRLAFSPLPLIGAVLIIYRLWMGQPLK